jgi:hypothetical protein
MDFHDEIFLQDNLLIVKSLCTLLPVLVEDDEGIRILERSGIFVEFIQEIDKLSEADALRPSLLKEVSMCSQYFVFAGSLTHTSIGLG